MLIPRSSNLIRQISKGLTTPLKQMRPQIKNLSQLSEKVANLDVKTCTMGLLQNSLKKQKLT